MADEQERDQTALVEEDVTLRRKRALYRAQHRGTKEMDWMIGRYAQERLDSMTVDTLGTFEAFLEVADPTLNAWLLDPGMCDQLEFKGLIDDIRHFNSLA